MNVQMLAMMQSLHDKLDQHTEEEMVKWTLIEAKLDKNLTAFPDEDVDTHRRYHERRKEDDIRQAEFVDSLKKEVGKWGIISILGFIGVAVWYAVTHWLAQHGVIK